MASEITYAEVKFKNESNSSGTYSDSATAPKVKPTPPLSKPGRPSLLFTSLMALFLLLAIAFLAAFILCQTESRNNMDSVLQKLRGKSPNQCQPVYYQKYSQLLEEKIVIKDITYTELNCAKDHSPIEDKVWSCCPKDWKPFSSHCYLISNDSASWRESEEKCSSMGAHLMVVHSQEEQDFITKILDPKANYYIGLSDPGHRQWRWVDQTPYNESATFWHPGEPNSDHEQCVIVNHRYSGWGWNDIPCSVKQKSVCQMKKIYL